MTSHGTHQHPDPNSDPFRTSCSLCLCGESPSRLAVRCSPFSVLVALVLEATQFPVHRSHRWDLGFEGWDSVFCLLSSVFCLLSSVFCLLPSNSCPYIVVSSQSGFFSAWSAISASIEQSDRRGCQFHAVRARVESRTIQGISKSRSCVSETT